MLLAPRDSIHGRVLPPRHAAAAAAAAAVRLLPPEKTTERTICSRNWSRWKPIEYEIFFYMCDKIFLPDKDSAVQDYENLENSCRRIVSVLDVSADNPIRLVN